MSFSTLEQNLFFEISANSPKFLKSSNLYPRLAFSQYVLKQFLSLYFLNTRDAELMDAYFKILHLKNVSSSLLMASHFIALMDITAQKTEIERQYDQLLFNTNQDLAVLEHVKLDNSWFNGVQTDINQKIDGIVTEISEKSQLSKEITEQKIEKLFERFHEILSVSIYSFQKAKKANVDTTEFKKQVHHFLQEYLPLHTKSFLYEYGLTLFGLGCIMTAAAIFAYPTLLLSLDIDALMVEITLAVIGTISMIINQYYPASHEEGYTNFFSA